MEGGRERFIPPVLLFTLSFTLSLSLPCAHIHTHTLSLACISHARFFASALLKVGCTKPPVEPLLEQQTRCVEKRNLLRRRRRPNGRRRRKRPFRFSPQQPVDSDPVAGRWFEWRARAWKMVSVSQRARRDIKRWCTAPAFFKRHSTEL